MVLYYYCIDGIKYSILILNNDGTKPFRGLCVGLLGRLSENQLVNIRFENKNGDNILFFQEILNLFRINSICSKDDDINECICGKKDIIEKYLIENKDTKETCIVGSTCIENWWGKQRKINACKFCGRVNKLESNCKNCSKMKGIRNIFGEWKELAQESARQKKQKIQFGKYKGLTYYDVCTNYSKYEGWINFILSAECKTSNDHKITLQRMLDKTKFDKPEYDISRDMARLML